MDIRVDISEWHTCAIALGDLCWHSTFISNVNKWWVLQQGRIKVRSYRLGYNLGGLGKVR